MRGKELELEQAAEAYRNLQWLKQQSEERERNTLREKDAIINQLQAALQSRSQETQVTNPCIISMSHALVDKPVLLVFFKDTAGALMLLFPHVSCFVCASRICQLPSSTEFRPVPLRQWRS